MKLLILTQYFPPETGAPQNRLFELAVRLKQLGADVTVLTAMPNYPSMRIYEGYSGKKYMYEETAGLKIHRSSIYVSQKRSIVARLRNYFSFVISSAVTGRKKTGEFDILLCESPPLFLGYTAMYLARIKKARLVFNVSDLWPESAEQLGVIRNKLLLKMAYRLEARIYRRSQLVTGQTRGICRSIQKRFPSVKTWWLPNGADLSLFDPAKTDPGGWRKASGFSDDDFLILYAGIIGLAQGLEVILHAAALLKDKPQIKFIILGEGPEKERLLGMKSQMNVSNVFFIPGVSKAQIPAVLRSVDAVVVPLKKLELFKGALPSKIFEALAMRLPLLLGVDGEARELFINEGKCGLYFEPENAGQLGTVAVTLYGNRSLCAELGSKGRNFVNLRFNRDTIAKEFYEQLRQL
jgi:glycosyltransferase involved in cell wall biosynthesis